MIRIRQQGLVKYAAVGAFLVCVAGVSAIVWYRSHRSGISFHDQFRAKQLDDWQQFGGIWRTEGDAVRSERSNPDELEAKLITGSTHWTNYRAEADIQLNRWGDVGLMIRASDVTNGQDSYRGYYAGLRLQDQCLVLGRASNAWRQFAAIKMPGGVSINRWYHFAVSAYGCTLHASATALDTGQSASESFFDAHCAASGKVGLRSYASGGLWRHFEVHAMDRDDDSQAVVAPPTPSALPGSTVRYTGLRAAAEYSGDPRIMPIGNPIPIDSLRLLAIPGPVHATVRGSVTLVLPGRYIQDATGGVQVMFRQPPPLRLGEEIEVTGDARQEGLRVLIEHAEYWTIAGDEPIPALSVTPLQAAGGRYDGMFVEVEGRVDSKLRSDKSTVRLDLNGGQQEFYAISNWPETADVFSELKTGSLVRVHGTCVLRPEYTQNRVPFALIVRSPEDLEVLSGPPWWSAEHLAELAAGMLLLGFLIHRLYSQGAQRRQLRDVINTIPAAVWSAAPDGTIDFVNEPWLSFTGASREDASKWKWEAVLHPDDQSRVSADWREAVQNGNALETESRLRRADGEYRWWFSRNVPLRDKFGKIVKWYGTGVDIEDRKRAESLLAGEKRILEMVAKGDSLDQILDSLCRLVEEQAPGALASISLLQGNCLRHGSSPSLPMAFTSSLDAAVIGPSAGSCGTAAYLGEPVLVEDIAGDPLWVDYRDTALAHSLRACWSTPVFSSQRKVIATLAMYFREPRKSGGRDHDIIEQITHLAGVAIERKLAQDALRRSEAYLAEAQRLTHMGSWVRTSEGELYWSAETYSVWGFDPQKSPPDFDALFQRVHPDDRERVRGTFETTTREQGKVEDEFRIVLPDGTVRHLHFVFHSVVDVSEQLGTVLDVTERIRAEVERERLRQLEADLRHMNRVSTMGELAASLSHEIKQPIAAAMTDANTSLRWLKREPPNVAKACEAVMRAVIDVSRASEIIDRMRSFYKKGTPPERELVDVNDLLREMIVLLRNEASRHSIVMRTELEQDTGKVRADRVQIQQVMMNLMLNGIEAMKDSGGRLDVRSQLGQDAQVLISISDTGVGLPAEKSERIFDAFFSTKPQGSGMGLTISRSIVEAHGGRVWAASNSGGGAIFCFTLPITWEADV